MKKLLSIDGGGALGCGPALMLYLLSREYGFDFDAYAGSSIGAALVCAYACGYQEKDVDALFMDLMAKIFDEPSLFWRLDPRNPKYKDIGLEQALCQLFGDRKMRDLNKPVFITSADFQLGRAKIWDRDDDALVRDVVRKSVAAPTYFSPVASRYCDGGLVANNPVMIGIGGMIATGAKLEEIQVLSLDTGGSFWKDPLISAHMLSLQWASPIIQFSINGNEERDAFTATQLLGTRHLRLTPEQDRNVEMDDLKSLGYWRGLWENMYNLNKTAIAHACNAQVRS